MTATDKTIMPYGEHKGKALANVPPSYLIYIYENYSYIRQGIEDYIKANQWYLCKEAGRKKTTLTRVK